MGTFKDFSNYANGLKRLERFLPRTRTLVIVAVCGVAAWYWHTLLVIVACGALLIAEYSADLATGLIVEGEAIRREISEAEKKLEERLDEAVAEVGRELSEIREKVDSRRHIGTEVAALKEELSGLRERLQDQWDAERTAVILREDLGAVKRVLGDIPLELSRRDTAAAKVEHDARQDGSILAAKTEEEAENLMREPRVKITDEEYDTAHDDIDGLIGNVRGLRERSRRLSAELRILRDAVEGIDPKAIRSMEDIRWWRDHAEERHEDHSKGLRSPYDRPEPSVVRLESGIDDLYEFTRILSCAIDRIDPKAMQSAEEFIEKSNRLVKEVADHVKEGHEEDTAALMSLIRARPEPSVARIEEKIGQLSRKIEQLRQRIEGEGT